MNQDQFMDLVMCTRDYPHFLISKFLLLRKLRTDSLLQSQARGDKQALKFIKTFEDILPEVKDDD